MNTTIISKQSAALIVVTLSIFLISACSGVNSQRDKNTPPELFSDFSENATFLLKQADAHNDVESTPWEMTAIQALTKEHQYQLADSVIEHVGKKPLNATQKNNLTLLTASKLFADNKLAESEQTLAKVDSSLLSTLGQQFDLKLKVNIALRHKDHQVASEHLLVLIPLLDNGDEIQHYNDMLLTQLSLLDPAILNKFNPRPDPKAADTESQTPEPTTSDEKFAAELAKIEAEMNAENKSEATTDQLSAEEVYVRGWYALAALYQRYQLRTNQLLQALDAWEIAYPNHAALDYMPTQLRNIPEAAPYQPTKIAVLLPLSGRFKAQASAIQYGISHAYYEQIKLRKQQQQEDLEQYAAAAGTTDAALNVQLPVTPYLQFFDTNKMNMQEIAHQLHQQDIDFVIGPLLKPNLAEFLPLSEGIPVLALNGFPTKEEQGQETEEASYRSAIHYAFPLSPENEAKQAADLIYQNHHKKPLLMVPNSAYGRRVSEAFTKQWQKLHLNSSAEHFFTAETHYFSDKSKFANYVAKSLQTDKSQQRINQMKAIVAEPLQTDIRSRRDIDAIYIVSNRGELILLKPFIAVTTSQFAPTIPLYASSRSHADDRGKSQNRELNGLTFSDIALVMDEQSPHRKQIDKVMPRQSMGNLRLFALGFDSYNLIEQLKQLEVVEGYSFQGLVGELTLDEDNMVDSTLQWGQYQRGKLVEITTATPAQ